MSDANHDENYLKDLRRDVIMHLLKYRFTPSEIKEATRLDVKDYLTESERTYFYTQYG